jgi:hypothetical protein
MVPLSSVWQTVGSSASVQERGGGSNILNAALNGHHLISDNSAPELDLRSPKSARGSDTVVGQESREGLAAASFSAKKFMESLKNARDTHSGSGGGFLSLYS